MSAEIRGILKASKTDLHVSQPDLRFFAKWGQPMNGRGEIAMQSFMLSVRQIGYAVRDLGATLRHFETVNGTAHEFWRFQVDLDAECDYRYRGKPASCRLDVALTTINGVDHEFIEVLEGRHPTRDYLEEHGEGVNHLALYLRDLSSYQEHAIAIGGEIIAEGTFLEPTSPSRRFCYIAFDDQPYPLYELVELRNSDRVID